MQFSQVLVLTSEYKADCMFTKRAMDGCQSAVSQSECEEGISSDSDHNPSQSCHSISTPAPYSGPLTPYNQYSLFSFAVHILSSLSHFLAFRLHLHHSFYATLSRPPVSFFFCHSVRVLGQASVSCPTEQNRKNRSSNVYALLLYILLTLKTLQTVSVFKDLFQSDQSCHLDILCNFNSKSNLPIFLIKMREQITVFQF